MRLIAVITGLVSCIVIILGGLMLTVSKGVGGPDRPDIGIPIIAVGAAIFPFILFCIMRLATIQTLVILIGIVSVAAGVFWLIDVIIFPDQTAMTTWPGIMMIVFGLMSASFYRSIVK